MKLKLSILTFFVVSTLNAITLSEAVQQGIQSDPEIQAEILHYDGKKISVNVAKSGYYPKVDLSGGVGWEDTDIENPHSQQTNDESIKKEVSARLRQPLFEGFATVNDVSRSTAEKRAIGYKLLTLSENKSLKIVKAYLNVLKTREIIFLSEKNLKTHEDILSSIEKRYKQGVSDKADLIQIKGRVANAKTDFYAAKNNALDADAKYVKVVGELPINLENIINKKVYIPLNLEEAIQKSIEKNPTILEAKENIRVVESKKDGTKSGYYPHLFGDIEANYKNDADGIDGTQERYQAMLRMEWNIFNGFKESYQYEIAQKDVLSVKQNTQETKRELILETTLSWNAYLLLNKQEKSLQEHVEYSKEAKKLYQDQYNVGRRSLIDVLNSQVEAFNAAKALISSKHDEVAAKYRILNSMGMLNKTLGVNVYK